MDFTSAYSFFINNLLNISGAIFIIGAGTEERSGHRAKT